MESTPLNTGGPSPAIPLFLLLYGKYDSSEIAPVLHPQKPIRMIPDKTLAQHSEKVVRAALEAYSVLVVDDDRTIAELLSITLRRAGHEVGGIAWNGREAVNMALKTRPDVIIMDIHMPVLDGILAAREILGARLIPIVFSTGMSDARSIHRAIDLQIISYLVTPFSPAQLNVAVHLAVANCRRLAELDVLAAA